MILDEISAIARGQGFRRKEMFIEIDPDKCHKFRRNEMFVERDHDNRRKFRRNDTCRSYGTQ